MVSEALEHSSMDCTSTLPWIWVIETLAGSKQVDASILRDLAETIPQISDDLGKNARDLISMKILESKFGQEARYANSASLSSSPKTGVDPSKQCEEFLRDIVEYRQTSESNLEVAGQNTLKWDVQRFIAHKRSNSPICALQKLKDAILTGSHPLLAPLKERSGLLVRNQPKQRLPVDDGNPNHAAPIIEERTQNDEPNGRLNSPAHVNGDNLLNRDLPDENVLPAKRNRRAITGNVEGQLFQNQIIPENGCEVHAKAAKKLKNKIIFSEQDGGVNFISSHKGRNRPPIDGNNGQSSLGGLVRHGKVLPCEQHVPQCDTEVPNDKSCKVQGQDNHIDKTASAGGIQQRICVDIEQDGGVNLISLRQGRNRLPDCNNGHTSLEGVVRHDDVWTHEQQAPHSDTEVPNDKSSKVKGQDNPVNEAKDDNEGVCQLRTDKGTSAGGIQQRICVDVDLDRFENSSQQTASNVDEAEDDIEHHHHADMPLDLINIAKMKNDFLSLQCTYSQDSLTTTDQRQLNLCKKCNKGGNLLLCSFNSCTVMVHEDCLSSAANFDARGNFYCPFCACHRAMLELCEIREKVFSARKDMKTFLGLGTEMQLKEVTCRANTEKKNPAELDDDLHENNKVNNKNISGQANNSQHAEYLEDDFTIEPSVSRAVDNPPREEKTLNINRAVQSLTEDNHEGKRTRQECQSPRDYGQQQTAVETICTSKGDIPSVRLRQRSNTSEKRAEARSKKGVSCQLETEIARQSAHFPNADAEEVAEEENESSGASKYFIRYREQEKQYTYPVIPQLRRKKVPWTSAEEDTLMDGIQRFCSPHDRKIPWTKILDFGAKVFHKGRTTIDLKDKWRNINKGSPKLI